MKTLMAREVALPIAALAAMGIALSVCSGGGAAVQAAPGSRQVSTSSPVSDQALGKALDRLVFEGGQHKSPDPGACLVAAAKRAKLSEKGQAYIAKTNGDDQGAVIEGLRAIDAGDAEVLLSPQLRTSFDACADAILIPQGAPDGTRYDSPKPARPPTAKTADLTPKYPIGDGVSITSASQLTNGLVSMLSSYAQDDIQAHIYKSAGDCLSGVTFGAGFSQDTLKFLAGGAPIGAGSLSDYLPKDEDKAIWRSQQFTASLTGCTTDRSPAPGSH